MTRRTNHVLREFVDIVAARITSGAISLERAAELMLEHRTPSHVVTRIISRAQPAYPALTA